ncbi:hypothetical protein EHI8A_086840 [Entamoeba histolytica HM-1:IMSS-B]|nr:hypothetical protein EHI8A_086840 [Entamoeba histolytica HM-1:IMSS-B]EMS16617.1 hypothetical protein KM1_004430 [Entamoeba histolytica HM-3:IMSS]
MTTKRAQPILQTSDNKNEEIKDSNNVMAVNLTGTKRLLTDITSTRNEEEKEKDIEKLKEENKTMKTMIQEQQREINQLKERIEQSNQLIRQILQILTK